MSEWTNDVRFWSIQTYEGKRASTHTVVWIVAGEQFRKPFTSWSAADGYRSELRTEHNRGRPFHVSDGLPQSMRKPEENETPETSWYELTHMYAAMKWKRASGHHRKGIAEALADITEAMFLPGSEPSPSAETVRRALRAWAYSDWIREGKDAEPPAEFRSALTWLESHTRPVVDLARPKTGARLARAMLDRISSKLDGTPAADSTISRKRATLTNILSYAVELEILPSNPLVKVTTWKPPKTSLAIDPALAPNDDQAKRLLDAVATLGPVGERLQAFFATIYYSAMRPEDCVAVTEYNIAEWPTAESAGEWRLTNAKPRPGGQWTDSGDAHELRPLKHRTEGEVRNPPIEEALAVHLRRHMKAYPVTKGQALFRGPRGGLPSSKHYGETWQAAREKALTPDEINRGIAETVYELRHARVSKWLRAGFLPAQVALWAGHTVAVLHQVYERVIDGTAAESKKRLAAKPDGSQEAPETS